MSRVADTVDRPLSPRPRRGRAGWSALLVLALFGSLLLGGGIAAAAAATAPTVPTALTATVTAKGTVTLKWSPPANNGGSTITGYEVSRDGTDANGTYGWSTVVPASARSQTFTLLLPDQWYGFTVTARTAAGTSPAATVYTTVPPPGVPFTGPAANTGSATITWSPPWTTNGATITGYRVARDGYDTDGSGAWSTTVPANIRSFTFTKLGPTSYTATVQAITTAGTGPASKAPVYTGTPQIFMGQVAGYTVTTNRAAGTATITWRVDPTGNHWQTPDGFLVGRDGVDRSSTGVWSTTVGATVRSFTFTQLKAGNTYRLSITPYLLWLTGKPSGPTSLTQTVTVQL
ncbi:fibronectin type III domain-containing protein [Nakamurella flava]|nr:fibronectin type III domain-containing protein [Nakamurella flava]